MKPLTSLKFSLLEERTKGVVDKVDNALDVVIEKQFASVQLRRAMQYAALNGGKRFRPLLMMAAGDLFDISFETLLPVSTAAELIHAYSLVHDDLPAMDNADTRRGKPSCWRQFDEATAILVGDGLLTLAFEVIASSSLSPAIALELVTKLAKASGPNGMVGGQMLDMSQDHQGDLSLITTLQRLKTGELIAFCCEAGAIMGTSDPFIKKQIKEVGYKIGLIYQMVDDLLDKKGEVNTLGKPSQQDGNKITLVDKMGEEQTIQKINDVKENIFLVLKPFGPKADLFREIITWAVERKS
ncbi:MAG: polyprenyl synthetase family protein [Alphaproteobacteria bacterium]|nr:polyprenyl synthetase family protein [Alphaproteobacteria bacterium]